MTLSMNVFRLQRVAVTLQASAEQAECAPALPKHVAMF